MIQFSNLDRVMEARDHLKNGTSSKSLMSRGKVIYSVIALIFLFLPFTLLGQMKVAYEKVENQELSDFFRLERIQYQKMRFTGKDLANKSYQLSVKEIWDGEITKDTIIFNSGKLFEGMGLPDYFKTVGDTILTMRVISKLTEENKLKMEFIFPRFSIPRKFEATSSDGYRLRYAVVNETVEYGKDFYVLVYMLPYEKDNMKHYCAVEGSGKAIETWGKEFGIKHYLIFEMKFEPL